MSWCTPLTLCFYSGNWVSALSCDPGTGEANSQTVNHCVIHPAHMETLPRTPFPPMSRPFERQAYSGISDSESMFLDAARGTVVNFSAPWYSKMMSPFCGWMN